MLSIADLIEELQQENETVDIFDEDAVNGAPSLVIETDHFIIALSVNDENIVSMYEDYNNDTVCRVILVDEDSVPDLYDELVSFLFWLTQNGVSGEAQKELTKTITFLTTQGYEPTEDWTPDFC